MILTHLHAREKIMKDWFVMTVAAAGTDTSQLSVQHTIMTAMAIEDATTRVVAVIRGVHLMDIIEMSVGTEMTDLAVSLVVMGNAKLVSVNFAVDFT